MVSMATRLLSGPGVRSQFAELVAPLTPVFVASGDQDGGRGRDGRRLLRARPAPRN